MAKNVTITERIALWAEARDNRIKFEGLEKTLAKELLTELSPGKHTGNRSRSCVVVPAGTTAKFDTARFRAEHPDLWQQYQLTSPRAGYLKG